MYLLSVIRLLNDFQIDFDNCSDELKSELIPHNWQRPIEALPPPSKVTDVTVETTKDTEKEDDKEKDKDKDNKQENKENDDKKDNADNENDNKNKNEKENNKEKKENEKNDNVSSNDKIENKGKDPSPKAAKLSLPRMLTATISMDSMTNEALSDDDSPEAPSPQTTTTTTDESKKSDKTTSKDSTKVETPEPMSKASTKEKYEYHGWLPQNVREMLFELSDHWTEYDVSVPRYNSYSYGADIANTGGKCTQAQNNIGRDQPIDSGGLDFGGRHGRHHDPFGGRHGRVTHGKGFTTDGRFLYIHCSRGLVKIGTGFQSTKKFEFYGCRSYRAGENVQIVWIDGKIYARSTSMPRGVIEVIDPNELTVSFCFFLLFLVLCTMK